MDSTLCHAHFTQTGFNDYQELIGSVLRKCFVSLFVLFWVFFLVVNEQNIFLLGGGVCLSHYVVQRLKVLLQLSLSVVRNTAEMNGLFSIQPHAISLLQGRF